MDIVVTVPKNEWPAWLEEGDLPNEPWSGEYSYFWIASRPRFAKPGDRVYIVWNNKLRGYAPLYRIVADRDDGGWVSYALVRRGGAVACTIDEAVRGFQGFRYRWWEYEDEKPFPEWRIFQ